MVSFQQTSSNKKTYVADAIVLLTGKKRKKLLSFCKLLSKYSFETRFGLVCGPGIQPYIYTYIRLLN